MQRLAVLCILGFAAAGLLAGRAQAAGDDITGFDDLKLNATYTPSPDAGDKNEDQIQIGGVVFDQVSRKVRLDFGGVQLDADLMMRGLQGQVQGIVITANVPPSTDLRDVATFAAAFSDSARHKYNGCKTLVDRFNDQAGMLALKDKDGDGLSLIWDMGKLSIIYQTALMGEANRRENGQTADNAAGGDQSTPPAAPPPDQGSPEPPARVR